MCLLCVINIFIYIQYSLTGEEVIEVTMVGGVPLTVRSRSDSNSGGWTRGTDMRRLVNTYFVNLNGIPLY